MTPPERVELAGWVEPAAAFRALAAAHADLVWSDRAGTGEQRGFLGVATAPPLVADAAAPDAFAAVQERLRAGLPGERLASAALGWWGWFGYELGVAAHGLPVAADESPAAAFLLAGVGVEFDHAARSVAVVALPGLGGTAAAVRALLLPLIGEGAPIPAEPAVPVWRWRHDRADYLALVDGCRRAIAAGDAYQLCLTNRITAEAPQPLDPLDLFLRMRGADGQGGRGAGVRGGGIVRIAGWTLVSASPETFLTVDAAGTAVSRPIKGTRPRGTDAAEDLRLAEELRANEKERAENVMIVDLVRNDLTRVAVVGSVVVTELFGVESYPAVHQLVSTVEARLAGEPLDAVAALFPAGSMTGAPKHAAMRLLGRAEAGPRGVYAGAWGRLAVDGTLALSVVIRSVVLHGTGATIGTGGGITILSDPEAEWREIELKAAPLLAALGVRAPIAADQSRSVPAQSP